MRKRQRFATIASFAFAALLLVSPVVGADDLTMAGTWRLDREKSHFSTGELPSKLVLNIEASGSDGFHYRSTNLVGTKVGGMEFTAKFDGKDYPITGSDTYDSVSAGRIDAHTFHLMMKKQGAVITDITYTVAIDRQSLRRTGIARKGPGKENHFEEWFDRQQGP